MDGQELRWTLLRFLSSSARPACPVSAVGLNAALRREHLRRDPRGSPGVKDPPGLESEIFGKWETPGGKNGVLMCVDVFLLGISARKLVVEWDIHGIDMGY